MDGEIRFKCPDGDRHDRNEKLLADLGFISPVHRKNTDYAAFAGQSVQKGQDV